MSDLEAKIKRFRDGVCKYLIRIAKVIADDFQSGQGDLADGGFFLLSGSVPYFEMIAQFQAGRPSTPPETRKFFSDGFRGVFPLAPAKVVKVYYDDVRCGLGHDAFVRGRVHLTREIQVPHQMEGESLLVNPSEVAKAIEDHFSLYVSCVEDPLNCDVRTKFEQMYDLGAAKAQPMPSSGTGTTPPPWVR